MKSLFKIMLVSACCLAFAIQAQTRPGSIKGQVLEKSSGLPALSANVVILDSASAQIAQGVTDFDGNYNINPVPAGMWRIEVTSIGFAKAVKTGVVVSPNAPTIINFTLQEETSTLQEVVVTYERPLIESGRTSTVISANDIQNMAVRNVGSVAAQAAGVTNNANGTTKIRGAREEGTVYFIDGVKVRGNLDKAMLLQLGYSVETRATADGEQYNSTTEMPFKMVNKTPLSTFSSDVDVAGYANVRRFLTDGYLPPKDAVRIEEMVNYFSYNYPQPKGDEKFGVLTEIAPCPWKPEHQLLRVGIQTEKLELDALPPNNLVFLIDVSGSMNDANKLPLLKKSLRLLVKNMRNEDRISIVVYASASGLVLKPTSGKDKSEILSAIDQLQAGGSTAGGAGITLAYNTAQKHFDKEANNRVILATDGDFNVGVSSQSDLIKLIEEKRASGIFLTVLGFGTGNYQDGKMEQLANHGNGNYAYIDNLMEAQKVLVTEMGASLYTVAKDAKFQIEFNPKTVLAYRLIGYENRLLADEDFNDDSKDAGDIGSGHSVTALYEIIPFKNKQNDSEILKVDDLKYQETVALPMADSGEIATVKLRYKEPEARKSKLQVHIVSSTAQVKEKVDFDFTCAVLQLGMLLKHSEYVGNSDYVKVIELAKASKGKDVYGYRGEFIRLAQLAQSLDTERKVGSN